MSEPALRCPGCGAPTAADAASCDYCGSALATVTCPSCFASMFAGSRFCARCGAEATRELIQDDRLLKCPRCRVDMQALLLGGKPSHECPGCGGQWLEAQHLQDLAMAGESRVAVIGVLAGRVPARPERDVVRYVPCPVCDRIMNRKTFAPTSGIVLDVCINHGVWLDRGELEHVLQFVETGGMARARSIELERFTEEKRRLLELTRTLRTLTRDNP